MDKKYLEKALIKRVILAETPLLSRPCEGIASLMIKRNNLREYELECFIYGDETKKFKKGETILVRLVLTNWAWKNEKLEREEQSIRLIPKKGIVVKGKIVDTLESKYEDSYDAIIDCGIYVKARVLKSQNFRLGDYIQAEGRLDAFKVEQEDE